MTIDERLDRLTERHEALAESLGLLTRDVAQLRTVVEETGKNVQVLLATAQQDGENIRGLARIAEIHERRLAKLEGANETPLP